MKINILIYQLIFNY